MLQLYFIRHGQSTNNVILDENYDNYPQERTNDPELTSIGLEQAALVAEALAKPCSVNGYDPQNRNGFGLTHLYCSLMVRAVRTGCAIAQKTNLPLEAWPELHETGGIFDVEFIDGERVLIGQPGPGRSFFETHFPQLVIPHDLSETGWYNREKEPHENYRLRAQAIIERLLATHGGTDHRVGIVMHAGIFAHILSVFYNIQAENYWFLKNNCGISRIDVSASGRVTLMYMNKVDQFPDHLIT